MIEFVSTTIFQKFREINFVSFYLIRQRILKQFYFSYCKLISWSDEKCGKHIVEISEIFLSHFFDKSFVKPTFLQNSWFDEKNSVKVNFSIIHTVETR